MTTESCFVIPEDAETEPAAPGVTTAPPAAAEKPSALPDNKTLAAFGIFILLAGGASVAVRITYGELAPFYSGAARFALAGLIFWVLLFSLQEVGICHYFAPALALAAAAPASI